MKRSLICLNGGKNIKDGNKTRAALPFLSFESTKLKNSEVMQYNHKGLVTEAESAKSTIVFFRTF